MSKKIFIQTAGVQPFIALIEDDVVLELSGDKALSRSEALLSTIDNGLIKLGWNPEEIEEVLFVNGPGSFTGLRIGLAIVQTWQTVYQTKINTINHEDYLRIVAPDFNAHTLVCIAAGMGSCFISSNSDPVPRKRTHEDIKESIATNCITAVIGDIPDYQRDAFSELIFPTPVFYSCPEMFLERVRECLQSSKEMDSITVRYLVKPHITKPKSS
jgi:tRNA A37 threonylcarbamoyladenosine modification protein TsaB